MTRNPFTAAALLTFTFLSGTNAQQQPPSVNWDGVISTAHLDVEVKRSLTALQAAVKDFSSYKKSIDEIETHATTVAILANVAQRQRVPWQDNAAEIQEIATALSLQQIDGSHAGLPMTRRRIEDLASLFRDAPATKEQVPQAKFESELPLTAMMHRLEASMQRVQLLATKTDTDSLAELERESVVIATFAKVIAETGLGEPNDHDFTEFAEALYRRANIAATAARKDDGKAFPMMWNKTKQSCANCHAEYR